MLMKKRIFPALLALAMVFSLAVGAPSAIAQTSDGKTVEIWLSRHGQTLANLTDVCQGQSDSPLTPLGRLTTQFVGMGLQAKRIEFDAVYSSNMGRCVQTAEILVGQMGRDLPIIQDRRLREMHMGDYELKTFSGFLKDYPTVYSFTDGKAYDFPGGGGEGESWQALWARVQPALLDIAKAHSDEGGRVLVTTHGYVILITMLQLDPTYVFKGNESLPNNSIAVLEYRDGKLTVKVQPTAEYSKIGMESVGVTMTPPARH